MRNKLSDLNDHLFAQIERLGDESTKGDALTEEIERSKALTNVAVSIVSNAALELKAVEIMVKERGFRDGDIPPRILESSGLSKKIQDKK